MEVILLERVEKLGQMGDVVNVKNGYARNFLLPRKKAPRATKSNISYFETQRKDLEARNLENRAEAEAVAGKMEGAKVVLIRQAGETGQLYGSVSARDIAVSLTEDGYKVERSQVVLDRPIKILGLHEIRVVLHPEVSQLIEANVARSPEEAELQAQGIVIGEQDVDIDEAAEVSAEEAAEVEASEDGDSVNDDSDSAVEEVPADDAVEEPKI
jgi:large subunit ribosomal protein L9